MKMMKREKVDIPEGRRKSAGYAKKSTSFGIIAACVGIMAAAVCKGMQLDKQEAEEKAKAEAAEKTAPTETEAKTEE